MASELSCADAFCHGFLLACAERGLGVKEAGELAAELVAEAGRQHVKAAGAIGDAVGAAKSLLFGLGAVPLVGSMGLGAAGGYLLGKATEPEIDPQDVRDQELIDTYDALAREAKLRQRLHAPQPPGIGSGGGMHL